ncbi:hypothetical protein [Myxococcus sp. Y35]|uniref:hypothetical protein n=1 Tax=Pseudomyxococcus flavus TaxID=3115648 RepID=UPI003CF3A938
MKKLIATLALCVGSAAFAQQQEQPSKTQVPRPGTEKSTGVDATEVGPAIGKAARDVTGGGTTKEGTFKLDKALSLQGTLKDADDDSVNLSRPGLPDAELDVRKETVLMLDGQKISKADQIPEGATVRARFQLEGDDSVAVELRATSPKGTQKQQQGTGGAGTQGHQSVDKELDGTPSR